MIGQIIQSYLVSLGVQIDKPGFAQADATIKQTGATVEQAAAKMNTSVANAARTFVKASTLIGSAIASVTASAVGLMKATAQEDLNMRKFARNMMMSEEAAWKMKKATDALGESINDISLDPELMGRFQALTADGSKMKVGGDFKETMKDFRDLIFEFTRLKQEASYALNWVGYYLMKYLQKPLADIRAKFKEFNDMVIKGMSVWTEKVAKAIAYVIEAGRHLLDFVVDLTKNVKKFWDSFPEGVKTAIKAVAVLTAVLTASPLTRALMAVGTLILLIDDYYGHMEGKRAAFGRYWDKLNEYIAKAKVGYEELKKTVAPYWDMVVGYAQQAKAWFDRLVTGAGELKTSYDAWMDGTGTELLNDFIGECKDLWGILTDLGKAIGEDAVSAWQQFKEHLEKSGTIQIVTRALKRLWNIIVMLYKAGKNLVRFFVDLYREISKSKELKEFREALMQLFDAVGELAGAVLELVQVALGGMFEQFGKKNQVFSFRDAMQLVLNVFTGLVKAVTDLVTWIKELFELVAKNKTFQAFWKSVGDAIDGAISKLGRFARALLAIARDKDLEKAKRILGGEDDEERHGTRELSEKEQKWEPYIQEYSKKHNVDPNLVRAVIKTESNFNPDAVSKAGAIGIGQFMPETAEAVGIDPYDPIQSIEGVAMHLRALMDTFGSEKLAIAAYNAGSNAVKKYGGVPPYQETQDYVEKVLNAKHDYESDEVLGKEVDQSVQIDRNNWRVHSSLEGYEAGWDSDVTNTRDLLPRTKEFLNYLGPKLKAMGVTGTITGGAEGNGYHYEGTDVEYRHNNGYKVDIDGGDVPVGSEASMELIEAVKAYGGTYRYHDGHWDITIPPGPSVLQKPVPPPKPAEPETEWEPSPRPVVPPEDNEPPEKPDMSTAELVVGGVETFRDAGIKAVAGEETGQEIIDVLNKAKETVYGWWEDLQNAGQDVNQQHEEVMKELEDYVKPTAYTTPKSQVEPLGLGYNSDHLEAEPTAQELAGLVKDGVLSAKQIMTSTPEKPQEPTSKVTTANLPLEMLVCMKQAVAMLAEIRKALPIIGSGSTAPAPKIPQEDKRDNLSQVTALLADIKKAILSLGTLKVIQPQPKAEKQEPSLVIPYEPRKDEGDGATLKQVVSTLQGIRKELHMGEETGQLISELQKTLPTDAMEQLQQAAKSLEETIPTDAIQQMGEAAQELPKALHLDEFQRVEKMVGALGSLGGFGRDIKIDPMAMKNAYANALPMIQGQLPVYAGARKGDTVQTINIENKLDTSVNVYGSNKVNGDVGKEVTQHTMQAMEAFFRNDYMNRGTRPT